MTMDEALAALRAMGTTPADLVRATGSRRRHVVRAVP